MSSLQSKSVERWRPASTGTASILRIANLTLRHLKLIVPLAILFGVLAFALASLQTIWYTSAGSFVLQTNQKSLGSMPGIAAQLGVSLPSADPVQSPSFYSELLKARSVLEPLVDTTVQYRTTDGVTVRTTVADAYHAKGSTAALRRENAIEHLSDAINVRVSKSGMVAFTLKAPAPDLAQRLGNALLDELSRFNLQRRQSQAAAERKFTERRLAEVKIDLQNAERALQLFLQANRSFDRSPELQFENQRLAREVELRSGLYSTLSQAYEQARIEEVRDTPQITLIMTPEAPARPDSRLRLGKAVVAAAFGALIGLLIGFSKERLTEEERSAGDEVAEFHRLRQATLARLRRPFRGPAQVENVS